MINAYRLQRLVGTAVCSNEKLIFVHRYRTGGKTALNSRKTASEIQNSKMFVYAKKI
jgi:hypothetical protein